MDIAWFLSIGLAAGWLASQIAARIKCGRAVLDFGEPFLAQGGPSVWMFGHWIP